MGSRAGNEGGNPETLWVWEEMKAWLSQPLPLIVSITLFALRIGCRCGRGTQPRRR